jgi:hypothetical protein
MWSAAATVLVIGLPLAVFDLLWLSPGAFLIVVTAGATAAHGTAAGWAWLLMAWSVPVLPVLAIVAAFTYIFAQGLDPMALVLVGWFGGVWSVVVAAIFGLAAMVEYVRFHLRSRRFGEPRPAWEDGPSQPT